MEEEDTKEEAEGEVAGGKALALVRWVL